MREERQNKAYEFLASKKGEVFDVNELAAATGWAATSVRTYIAKKWRSFLNREGPNRYRVTSFPFTPEEFINLQTQAAPIQVLQPTYDYDVTLSFAGDDRQYVERVAAALNELGVRVFYDRYEEVDMWGKNLYEHLDEVYRQRARFCVIFISTHYANKLWTNHERRSAQARAFEEKAEYILPVRFDNTEVPGMLPTTGYVDGNNRSPEDLALLLARKTGLDTDLEGMLQYLREFLTDYSIELNGTAVRFQCESEGYDSAFPTRLLVEMYREDMLDSMFLMPAIVPW
ncbi:MAG: TIR domain-containing protein [Gammaproteobacteria bacterium]